MFRTPVLRALEKGPTYIDTNVYRAKRLWPPDFEKLSTKHQFRLERRYRRRSKLKWARPKWTKAVKIAQLGSIVFVTVYGVLFADWKQENEPFQGLRNKFRELTGSIWTTKPERGQRREGAEGAGSKPNVQ
ncbi:hypothetical protein VC83_03747 [Pseudogymnoascus destructans]|uniref:Uncharacterized protein n=2 Tax=Pseudogymnoascus destructans TaxID=655981 RepID=L8G4G7_PSED2|nr:uncharacterized protein VC83_03747 [Pseudogymnoascus destructans]ELR07699.1 hypothetical protein GMDG_02721 [Pseudogymnoascus destructans 20631-21]OAF59555.1 hypothetical protein VC83_03747 [Pseudogymnoascus destructans]